MRQWYVVHTQARSEERAAVHLANQGFDAFLPRLASRRRHARRVNTVAMPLFPRYLFVAFDTESDTWRSINGTRGVSYLLTRGERPLPVPAGFVENLQECSDSLGLFATKETLAPGTAVQVLDGPFADLIGRVERMAGEDRVVVLLELMGGVVRTAIPAQSVALLA